MSRRWKALIASLVVVIAASFGIDISNVVKVFATGEPQTIDAQLDETSER